MKIETLAVHAGHTIDPATGAVASPIHLSTTFERDAEGTYSRGFMYTRNDNPNRQALEQGVSALEGGAAAAAFAPGWRRACRLPALAPGDHVLAHVDAYYGTADYCAKFFCAGDWNRLRRHERSAGRGKSAAAKDKARLDGNAIESAVKNCRSRGRSRRSSHEAGAICVCDNTWAPIDPAPIRSRRGFQSSIPRQNISAAIVTCSEELLSPKWRTIFFSVSARFNTKVARSPRLSIAG